MASRYKIDFEQCDTNESFRKPNNFEGPKSLKNRQWGKLSLKITCFRWPAGMK